MKPASRLLTGLLSATVLFSTPLLYTQSSFAESPQENYALGQKAFNTGKIEDAIRFFRLATEAEPTYNDAYFNLGALYYNTKQYNEALEAFNKLLQNEPQDQAARYETGRVYEKLGRLDEAIAAYELIQSSYPRYSTAQENVVRLREAKAGIVTNQTPQTTVVSTTTVATPLITTSPETKIVDSKASAATKAALQKSNAAAILATGSVPTKANTTSLTVSPSTPATVAVVESKPLTSISTGSTGNSVKASELASIIQSNSPTTTITTTTTPAQSVFQPAQTSTLASTSTITTTTIVPETPGIIAVPVTKFPIKPQRFTDGFFGPTGLAVDSKGNLFVANFSKNTIFRVSPSGKKELLAKGTGINGPVGLTLDNQNGDLYIANHLDNTVARISPTGVVTVVATGLKKPYNLFLDQTSRTLYVTQQEDNSISKIQL